MKKNESAYLLPAEINPLDRRYVCVPIPDEQMHILAFLGQIDALGYWWNWERDSLKQGTQVARVWRDIAEELRRQLDEDEECGTVFFYDPCRTYSLNSNNIDIQPQNPFTDPDYNPPGYAAPPFAIVKSSDTLLLLMGFQVGDMVTDISRFPTGSLPTIIPPDGFARFRVSWEGSATVDVELLQMELGGLVSLQLDGNPFTAQISDLVFDVAAVPAENDRTVIQRVETDTEGDHYLDVTFLPMLNDAIPFVSYGGGVRRITICKKVYAAPPPYWDAKDGDDADGEDHETGFPWYEDAKNWVVTAFLATTFTPDSAIQFVTTSRKLRLFFRTRDYGAIANIFLDDEMIWQQDTYSETPGMVQFAYDILDNDPTHTLRIVHSGEANQEVISPSTALEVIRKRIDWGTSVFAGSGVTGGSEENDIRYDPVTDTFQQTTDGGATWQSAPWADPRKQNQFPPPNTPDPMCDAAARMVGALQQAGLGYVNELHAAASVYALASVPMAILGAFFGFGLLLPAAVVGANALVTAGHDAVKAAYEAIDWEALQCQLYCSLGLNGVLDDAGFFELQSYVNTLPFGQQMILNSVLNLSGRGGLNNLASTRTETGECECPDCCGEYESPLNTQKGGWDYELPYAGISNLWNGSLQAGTWQATGGRSGGCWNSALIGNYGTPLSSKRSSSMIIDLQVPRDIFAVRYWHLAQGGGAISRQIVYYDETGARITSVALGVTPNSWQQMQANTLVSNCRYIQIGLEGNAAQFSAMYLDDITIEYC